MNCLLVMKIKWSLDINTGAVERSEAARARSLAGATVGVAKYPSIFDVGVPIIQGGAKYPRIFGMVVQDILGCQISCDTGYFIDAKHYKYRNISY